MKSSVLLSILLLNTVLGSLLPSNSAFAQQPLLIPEKQSLFQRVLSVPGAVMLRELAGQEGAPVTPFTAFYVYAREQRNQEEFLEVGIGRHGDTAGWLRSADTLEWNQGLTVAFRNPKGHDRALLFRDAEALREIADAGPDGDYAKLYQDAVNGKISADSPVVAIQPPGVLDLQKDFYLVPIRDHRDIYVGNERARMLRVASVPLNPATQPTAAPLTVAAPAPKPQPKAVSQSAPTPKLASAAAALPQPQNDADLPPYRAGLVFVLDSTLSMDPYIDRTRAAVKKIHTSLEQANLLGNVNFGMVAFRDNLQSVPELGFLSRTYVDLDEGGDPATFLDKVDSMQAAKVSSEGFIEDAYAGIARALEDMPWEGHAARYLVLVTDAGPRLGDDPLSGTGLDTQAIRQMARDKGVAIFVLHLLTPSTVADHASAAATYRELSSFPGIGSLYYGVPTGDVAEFGQVLDAVARQITLQVQIAGAAALQPEVAQESMVEPAPAPEPLPVAPEPAPPANVTPQVAENPQLAELQSKVAKLGYALRMQYLQKTEGGKLPRLFNAWLLDRDLRDPTQRTLDVQVLLTRDQLSELHDILKQVLLTAEEGLLSPQNFLNELKSLAATLARDPERLGETTATTAGQGNSLADMGFMAEYIEDLPYTGEVMNLSLQEWDAWPAREQIDFLNRLDAKIAYYRALHDHTDLWVSLDGDAVDGDSVFPVPLDMLP